MIQIFGTRKCADTRKAERYFRERSIPYQFVDLNERGLSKGELDKVKAVLGVDNLIDRAGKEFAKRNLKYIVHVPEEMLLQYPLLFRTPIVRNGAKVTVGHCPQVWDEWR